MKNHDNQQIKNLRGKKKENQKQIITIQENNQK